MWYVLHARPGAQLILGLRPGVTPETFRQAISDNSLEVCLHHLSVTAGDAVFVPSGTLHAILEGVLIAEIQQNSNTTYRVYDWNRVGSDGQPRPLHVDKALDVINFDQVEPQISQPDLIGEAGGIRRYLLCRNQYFTTERVEMSRDSVFEGHCNGGSLEIWGSIKGTAEINGLSLEAVRFCLLPATLGSYSVQAVTETTLLRTYVGEEN